MFDIDKELRGIKFDTAHPSAQLKQKTQQLVMQEVRKKQQSVRLGRLSWVLTPAITVIAAILILFSLPSAADEVSYYTVDINPSISMQVDASETVLEVSAENDDAVMLLEKVKLEGLPFEKALSEFVGAADDQGYLKDQGHVLVAHFGETAGLSQEDIEDVVSGATERKVTALVLQSTTADFEKAKTQHSQPGIELLKKQAADQGIEEQDVDEIIEKIRGNSNKQKNGNKNTPQNDEKADNRPTGTAAKNDKSEKNNGSTAGNSENAKNDKSNGSGQDDKVKGNSGNSSDAPKDKPVSGGSGGKNEDQSSGDGNKNNNDSDDTPNNNGDGNKNDNAGGNEDQSSRDRDNGNRQDSDEQEEQGEDEEDDQDNDRDEDGQDEQNDD